MTHALVSTGLDHLPFPTVVIIGGGFAGITLVQKLVHKPLKVILIDRNNFHTFQPLLYQVATGSLAPDNIGFPFRRKISNMSNVAFRKAEVESIDPQEKTVITSKGVFSYDYLVLATGSKTNFYGNSQLEKNAMQLKSISQALDIRSAFLQEFENAMYLQDNERMAALNFVVVGGGPTGVEVSGALAEIRKNILTQEYKEVGVQQMHITLIEAGPRVLSGFSEKSSEVATEYLEEMGVRVMVNHRVKKYNGEKLVLEDGSELLTKTVIWSAGVMGGAVEGFPKETYTKNNRLSTDAYLRVKGVQDIFAMGDVASVDTEPTGHPMIAPVAIQQAHWLSLYFQSLVQSQSIEPFVFHDKGSMATIGRNKAVVEFGPLRFQGLVAWYIWMFVHLVSLIGFKNRLVVLFHWAMKYFSYKNVIHLIVRPYDQKKSL